MMTIKDALNILNPQSFDKDGIKLAYRKAAAKYHPDINPAGLEMMKLVNVAYDVLTNSIDLLQNSAVDNAEYSEKLNDALNAIAGFGLVVEICGAWVWVTGNTRTYKDALKKAGFKWASKKLAWYFRPDDHKSTGRGVWSLDKIRETYGSNSYKSDKKYISI